MQLLLGEGGLPICFVLHAKQTLRAKLNEDPLAGCRDHALLVGGGGCFRSELAASMSKMCSRLRTASL
jgi:hypothetical protein